jgi:hypothetical protein
VKLESIGAVVEKANKVEFSMRGGDWKWAAQVAENEFK